MTSKPDIRACHPSAQAIARRGYGLSPLRPGPAAAQLAATSAAPGETGRGTERAVAPGQGRLDRPAGRLRLHGGDHVIHMHGPRQRPVLAGPRPLPQARRPIRAPHVGPPPGRLSGSGPRRGHPVVPPQHLRVTTEITSPAPMPRLTDARSGTPPDPARCGPSRTVRHLRLSSLLPRTRTLSVPVRSGAPGHQPRHGHTADSLARPNPIHPASGRRLPRCHASCLTRHAVRRPSPPHVPAAQRDAASVMS